MFRLPACGADCVAPAHAPAHAPASFAAPLQRRGAHGIITPQSSLCGDPGQPCGQLWKTLPAKPQTKLRHKNKRPKKDIMAKKILAVDDEKHIVRLVQINLQKEGYDVVTASNGREALERMAVDKPDLVIMDVMMPEMDGFSALEKLKGDPATADIPIIMLTAKAQDADVFQGWKSGADLYLTKPFNPQELLTFVRRIFQGQTENADDTYNIDEAETYSIDDTDGSLIAPSPGEPN